MATTHHTITYVELVTPDLEAARAFYTGAFGWELNDYGPTYAGIRSPAGTGAVGGRNPPGPPGPGGALVLIQSADLDASVAAVEGAGGTLVTPPEAYPGGRRFTFADPAGNVLGVFQPA